LNVTLTPFVALAGILGAALGSILASHFSRTIDRKRSDYGGYYLSTITEPVAPAYLSAVRPLKWARFAACLLALAGTAAFLGVIIVVQTGSSA
jgi:hypothetical protein